MASTGTATPGEYASDRSRCVAIGLVATTSSLPGLPTLWNCRASCSVKVGRLRPGGLPGIATPLRDEPERPAETTLAEAECIAQAKQDGTFRMVEPRPAAG